MKFHFHSTEYFLNYFLTDSEKKKYEHVKAGREKNSERLGDSLKGHLSTLNDGVAAIIITVMLLEIPFPTTQGEYKSFLWSILVFLVSFFVVAGFWYDNKRIFEAIQKVDHAITVLNFVFLASLALIPVMTKWIMRKTDRFAVLNYGVVYLLTMLLHYALYFAILRKRFHNEMSLFWKMMFFRAVFVLVPNILLLILGWHMPRPVMVLYLALPIVGFLQPEY